MVCIAGNHHVGITKFLQSSNDDTEFGCIFLGIQYVAVESKVYRWQLRELFHHYWRRCRFRCWFGCRCRRRCRCRLRFIIYRFCPGIGFPQINFKPCQGIKLPVGVICLFGIEMIIQQICAPFQCESYRLAQTEIDAQSEASTQESFTVFPKIFQIIIVGIQSGGAIFKTVGIGTSHEKVRIDRSFRIVTAQKSGQIENKVDISLYKFEIVHLSRSHPSTFGLPSGGADAHPEHGRKLITQIECRSRRDQVCKFCFTQRMGCTTLQLQGRMGFEYGFSFFLYFFFLCCNKQGKKNQCEHIDKNLFHQLFIKF